MDLSTIIGWVAGLAVTVWGIAQGKDGIAQIMNFWDFASAVIVPGGTIAVLIASYPFSVLSKMPKHMKIIMGVQKYDAAQVIGQLVEMAKIARKNGLLVLEEQAKGIKDPFLKKSIMLIVDAMDADKIRDMLENEVGAMLERHDLHMGIYDKGTSVAPAFGMIGTLVGLVNMLKSMDMSGGGASELGNNMSVALITTFYGCMLAHLLFAPISKKLRIRNDEELLYKEIIIEGVLSIQAGDNPKFLEEKLMSRLSPSSQKKSAKKKGNRKSDSDD